MKKIKAHIEGNGQGLYSVYVSEDLPYHLIGDGFSIEEAKTDFVQMYNEVRQDYKKRTGIDTAYTFEFILDLSALLQHYKNIITLAGLAKLTGINKNQLSQYACGRRIPSPKTLGKIKCAIQSFADELSNAFA